MDDEPDPRTEAPGICGATRIGSTGIEWVCIKPVHGTAYTRKRGDRTHRAGDLIINDTRTSVAHYMVNRWPNRKQGVDTNP